MVFEAISLARGELILTDLEQQTIRVEAVQVRAQRCIALLDLIDSHIIISLQVFSTPVDAMLENLRAELEALQCLVTWSPVTIIATTSLCDRVLDCRSLLDAVNSQVYLLGPVVGVLRCALSYLGQELDALTINKEEAFGTAVMGT